jgi:hypothetical protein
VAPEHDDKVAVTCRLLHESRSFTTFIGQVYEYVERGAGCLQYRGAPPDRSLRLQGTTSLAFFRWKSQTSEKWSEG